MQQQFDELQSQHPDFHFNYEFFTGINGKENPTHPLFSKYNSQKRQARKGNDMSLSQLGCFASHYLLLEKCIQLDEPIVILEDDAVLLDNFSAVIQYMPQLADKFEFFRLSNRSSGNNIKSTPLLQISNTNVYVSKVYKGWANLTGYFITPRAAKKFLNHMEEWVYNVDIAMDRYWENKVHFCALLPNIVRPQGEFLSQIQMDNTKRRLSVKIKREIFATYDRICKLIFDLTN
ncbi:MAG: glycosyltransferase family 25 protein [[Actinobacillus] rossii]|uniref:Glycosyl transferase family protein n=1 Tax=[Actinobacillus] rossii TaxID=123820 RepID=A0A380TQ22_9PAST|nr:glycosyltransferase family 25 protein [[Actinobacillus] rossii]MDY4505313.1 glycosyltransferase family 25 protein [[Actinobacillus] rossii]SUT89015.1 glycosyl transferase family protein [[Actinobacillus] rossii]